MTEVKPMELCDACKGMGGHHQAWCGTQAPAAAEEGRKDDRGKAPWALVPFEAMTSVVQVLGFGAAKYGVGNWQQVDDPRDRYFSAAMRHLVAWRNGERLDAESGLPHLAHAVCCVLFLLAGKDGGKR